MFCFHLVGHPAPFRRALYGVDKARRELGYRPRYEFGAFVTAWRRGQTGHYPFAEQPWWGAERPRF